MATAVVPGRSVNTWAVGIVAGIIGGALIDLYLVIAHPLLHLASIYQHIASNVVGPAALASPAYAWLGGAMHFGISAAWGVLYVALARRWPMFLTRPLIWGPIYGLLVMVVMNGLLVVKGGAPPHTTMAILNTLVVHCVCFGLPVALYASYAARRALPSHHIHG